MCTIFHGQCTRVDSPKKKKIKLPYTVCLALTLVEFPLPTSSSPGFAAVVAVALHVQNPGHVIVCLSEAWCFHVGLRSDRQTAVLV